MKHIDKEMAYHYAKELEMDAMFDGTSKQNLARAYLQLLEEYRYSHEKLTGQIARLHELTRLQAARLVSESWSGQVDHMSGAFDPNDRHEMGG